MFWLVIDSGLVGSTGEGCRESRRCSRDAYPDSYTTRYTRIRIETQVVAGRLHPWQAGVSFPLSLPLLPSFPRERETASERESTHGRKRWHNNHLAIALFRGDLRSSPDKAPRLSAAPGANSRNWRFNSQEEKQTGKTVLALSISANRLGKGSI